MPSLFVISTDERYPLTPGEHVAGRLQSCALTLNEVQASRRQFALRSRGSRWTVCDLGSRNGTSLNAQRLTETPVPLHHGDRISVGETVIRYDVELDPLVPGTELGGVTVAKRRGRSEYGTLYHGRQGALDRDVVVEVLDPDLAGDPEFVSAYQHRARSAGAFEHPAVLTVLDVVAGDKTYTVFELFGGSSLAERWRGDDLVLAAPRVHVQFMCWENDDQVEPRLLLEASDPAGFTALDLLSQTHNAVARYLREHDATLGDHRFFEGLSAAAGDREVPLYFVDFGS